MTKQIDESIKEILDFFDTFPFDTPSTDANFKQAYKQFHSLLVWGYCFEKETSFSDENKMFYKETLSDLSHALFLLQLNLYKPARFSLRSSIENFIRTILIFRGVNVKSITSVYDLFEKANQTFTKDKAIKVKVGTLKAFYSELCKSAHSAKVDYLSLVIPLKEITVFNNAAYEKVTSQFYELSREINQISFMLHFEILKHAGHKNSDTIKDSLPRMIKRMQTETN